MSMRLRIKEMNVILTWIMLMLCSQSLSIVSIRIILNAIESWRNISHICDIGKSSKFIHRLIKIDSIWGSIKEVPNWRIVSWHRIFINSFFQTLNKCPYHIFLRDHCSPNCNSRPLCPCPYFHNSPLINPNIITFHGKAPHVFRKLWKSMQRLMIKMYSIWERNVPKVAQSNWNFL